MEPSPHITVIITAYDPDLLEEVVEAVRSVLRGTYESRDVIVAVDGTVSLAEKLEEKFAHLPDVEILLNRQNIGAAASRNRAVESACGGIVAFMDDDAIADERWLEELSRCYTEHNTLAAGGKVEAIWLEAEPDFLPEEYYWLIGVTYRGFPEELTEVRNTFASNLSVDRLVFQDLGGFNPNIGPTGASLLQSAETEFCARLKAKTGSGVLYNPDAVMGHKIFPFRTGPIFLLRRAFWQGVSKRGVEVYAETDLATESAFIGFLLKQALPERCWGIINGRRRKNAQQLLFLLLATVCVGLGYLWGRIKFPRRPRK